MCLLHFLKHFPPSPAMRKSNQEEEEEARQTNTLFASGLICLRSNSVWKKGRGRFLAAGETKTGLL